MNSFSTGMMDTSNGSDQASQERRRQKPSREYSVSAMGFTRKLRFTKNELIETVENTWYSPVFDSMIEPGTILLLETPVRIYSRASRGASGRT
jgi:hypothetical protein